MISSSPRIPLASMPIVIPTLTLGRAWVHELDVKLAEAGKAGLQGIELFWEDLVYAAKRFDPEATETSEGPLLQAAQWTRGLCDQHRLEIYVLQPFLNYDGLVDPEAHNRMIKKLHLWFKIAKILRTDIIQVASQMNSEGTTGNEDKIVADIRELGELGLKQSPPIRFVYEAMAWGAHLDLWQQVWRVVQRVNLPNVGILLDTFQLLGRVYADPTSPSGKLPNADEAVAASLRELANTPGLLPKIFFIQLSDAERLDPPLSPSHPFYAEEQLPRMQWSRNARLFPCEEHLGGYLPVLDMAKVLFEEIGYRGIVSMEVFSRTMTDPDPSVPRDHAERAMRSWKTLQKQLKEPKHML